MDPMRLYYDGVKAIQRATLAACLPAKGAALLDLGCGDGQLTMAVAGAVGADRVSAIEIDPSAGQMAAERGIEVSAIDLCDRRPYPDESFGVVHTNQVIEHVPCTDHFVSEIRRVLKPDGYAIVCTNNLASWHNVLSLMLGSQPSPCHVSDETFVGGVLPDITEYRGRNHLRIFTSRALESLALHHGLRSEIAEGVAYYPLTGRAADAAARLDRRHAAYILHRLRRAD